MYLRTVLLTANAQLAVLAAKSESLSSNNLSAQESKKNGKIFKVHGPVDFMYKKRNGNQNVRIVLVNSTKTIFLKNIINMLVSFSTTQ